MKVVGLTGGVGMGKSAAADLLSQRGVPLIDTDDLARQVVEPGQPALSQILQQFGHDLLDCNGRLIRAELARRVFSSLPAREKLESIMHPLIRQLWKSRVDAWRQSGERLGVVVIPLLFETKAERELDVTVCVACTAGTQRQRLGTRGWSDLQIRQRVAAQWAVESKMALADYVIWTEGSMEAHALQLDRVLERLRP